MNEDHAHYAPVDPVKAGLTASCPRCGQGRLFDGYSKIKPRCSNCGLDYSFADSGDGPAIFVILLAGFVVVALAVWVEVTYEPPLWVHALLWIPATLIISLGMLRPLKGLMVALQYRHKAAEGRLDRRQDP